jgi:hypothetical protein
MTLSITATCHYPGCRYAECRDLFIEMLNVVMLSVVMLSVVMLSVIMLIVVAPLIPRKVRIEKFLSYFFKDFRFFSEGDGCKLITKYNNNDSYLIMNIILTLRWWAGKFLGN